MDFAIVERPKLVILDVGHGNCTILFDNKGIVVIDAGPGSSLLEFLVEHKINKVDAIFITHADKDHIEGVIALLASKTIEIGIVKLNSDALKATELWDDLVYQLDKSNSDKKLIFEVGLTTNDSGKFGYGDIQIEIVSPGPYLAARSPGAKDRSGRTINTNTTSAMIRLLKNSDPLILMASDIDELGLEYVYNSRSNLQANILIFPHHGGKSGLKNLELFARELTERVNPKIVVFSVSRFGKMKNPQPEVIAGIRSSNPKVRILCTQLSQNCASALPDSKSLHFNNIYSRGHGKNACCAGSIVIEMKEKEIRILPESESHLKFVEGIAPNALCNH